MYKICIIIDTLLQGGAHRVACIQANALKDAGYNVTILFFVKPPEFPFLIRDDIEQVYLLDTGIMEGSGLCNKIFRRIFILPLLIKKIKKIRPDLLISHIQGVNAYAIFAARTLHLKVIVSEHTTHLLPNGLLRNKLATFERKYIYRMANLITVLTRLEVDHYKNKYLSTNVILLRNPCSFESINTDFAHEIFETRTKSILAVGDINRIEIKGWDTLLEVFAEFSKHQPEWKLNFVGGGVGDYGKNKLIELINSYNLQGKVFFLGPQTEINKIYQSAGIFILSSRNEGLPMVIVEAMSQGCPVVSFDCATGPGEIIDDHVDGLLVSNQNKIHMINSLKILVQNDLLRKKISLNGIIKAKSYALDKYIEELQALIKKVMK